MVSQQLSSAAQAFPALRYALPGWAVIALLCTLLPASLQAQWGLLASSWFWALLALLAWQGLRLPQATRRRWRRRRRGATPLSASPHFSHRSVARASRTRRGAARALGEDIGIQPDRERHDRLDGSSRLATSKSAGTASVAGR